MGVLAEELRKHDLPIVFIDTQDEYAELVTKLGGHVRVPGKDFTIRISSLTERELINLIPAVRESDLQQNIIAAAYNKLQEGLKGGDIPRFTVDDLVAKIQEIGPDLTNKKDSIDVAARRTGFLKRHEIFGEGVMRENWPKTMYPCLSIRCKGLTAGSLQTVATGHPARTARPETTGLHSALRRSHRRSSPVRPGGRGEAPASRSSGRGLSRCTIVQ